MRLSGTKRLILDAALELGAIHGISGTTMDDVAVRAGVAKGSLYYNFASKDRLFEELLTEGIRELGDALLAIKLRSSGQAALVQLVDGTLARIQGNIPLARLMVAELFRTDRPWKESLFEVRHRAIAVYAEAIDEAAGEQAAGEQVAGVAGFTGATPHCASTSIMASALFGAVLLAGLEWILFEPQRDRAEIASAVALLLSGRFAV